jgi:hypothetical protein
MKEYNFIQSKHLRLIVLIIVIVFFKEGYSQNLYTARGYWQETNKEQYRSLLEKKEKGLDLTQDESNYLSDYEAYLKNYFSRLSDQEKSLYEQMKQSWDRELALPKAIETQEPKSEEFDWRPRDRGLQAVFGIWYGTSLAIIAELDNGAAAGVPLITGGLWMLGPVINPKKYEDITISTIRASNTGKVLGLGYGAALGLAIAGDSEDNYKLALGLSTLSSIILGEAAFQAQKKKNFSDGHIELMRHYGFLGPYIGISALAATETESTNLIGVSLLAGGVAGLAIGNNQARKYDYSRGDVDFISSLSLLSAGVGFTGVINYLENNSNPSSSVLLIPAATTIIGTVLGQRMVKNVHLTKKQGSTINLGSSGAGLFGLGILLLTETESSTAWIGVPTALALMTQQLIFAKFKKENLLNNLQGSHTRKNSMDFSMRVNPENYFINKQFASSSKSSTQSQLNPVISLSLKFK